MRELCSLHTCCSSDVCATMRPSTLWAHCHCCGILQIPIFLHLETLLLAGADPMTMTIVEKSTSEFLFWFITQRALFAADLNLLWVSSGGLGDEFLVGSKCRAVTSDRIIPLGGLGMNYNC